ncbi:MAG: hypothetical protein HYX48_05850 [Chlamydiales bacterium]|nr:hypothetical protein [Chlamydiales bacterium]
MSTTSSKIVGAGAGVSVSQVGASLPPAGGVEDLSLARVNSAKKRAFSPPLESKKEASRTPTDSPRGAAGAGAGAAGSAKSDSSDSWELGDFEEISTDEDDDEESSEASGASRRSTPEDLAPLPDSARAFAQFNTRGFEEDDFDEQPVKPKPSASGGEEATPTPVREVIGALGTEALDSELTPTTGAAVAKGARVLKKMAEDPARARKAHEYGKRAFKAMQQNLTQGAAPGSLESHRKGVAGLKDSAVWVDRLLPSLGKTLTLSPAGHGAGGRVEGAGGGAGAAGAGAGAGVGVRAAPVEQRRFWNEEHICKATVKSNGKTLVGLHLMKAEVFHKAYKCEFEVMNPHNGVVGRLWSDGKAKPKYSSFFPDWIEDFQHLVQLVDSSPMLAAAENRQLVRVPFKDRALYVELFLQERGFLVHGCHPFFAYFTLSKEKIYTAADKIIITKDRLIELCKAGFEAVDPNAITNDCPLRYIIRNKDGGLDLVFDVARMLAKETGVELGILVQVPSEFFDHHSKLIEILKNRLHWKL